jgi:hypothetical protein
MNIIALKALTLFALVVVPYDRTYAQLKDGKFEDNKISQIEVNKDHKKTTRSDSTLNPGPVSADDESRPESKPDSQTLTLQAYPHLKRWQVSAGFAYTPPLGPSDINSTHGFIIPLRIIRFITPQVAVGGVFSWQHLWEDFPAGYVSQYPTTIEADALTAGLTARYYFSTPKKLRFYGDASLSFANIDGSDSNGFSESAISFMGSLGMGVTNRFSFGMVSFAVRYQMCEWSRHDFRPNQLSFEISYEHPF